MTPPNRLSERLDTLYHKRQQDKKTAHGEAGTNHDCATSEEKKHVKMVIYEEKCVILHRFRYYNTIPLPFGTIHDKDKWQTTAS